MEVEASLTDLNMSKMKKAFKNFMICKRKEQESSKKLEKIYSSTSFVKSMVNSSRDLSLRKVQFNLHNSLRSKAKKLTNSVDKNKNKIMIDLKKDFGKLRSFFETEKTFKVINPVENNKSQTMENKEKKNMIDRILCRHQEICEIFKVKNDDKIDDNEIFKRNKTLPSLNSNSYRTNIKPKIAINSVLSRILKKNSSKESEKLLYLHQLLERDNHNSSDYSILNYLQKQDDYLIRNKRKDRNVQLLEANVLQNLASLQNVANSVSDKRNKTEFDTIEELNKDLFKFQNKSERIFSTIQRVKRKILSQISNSKNRITLESPRKIHSQMNFSSEPKSNISSFIVKPLAKRKTLKTKLQQILEAADTLSKGKGKEKERLRVVERGFETFNDKGKLEKLNFDESSMLCCD